MPRNSLLRRNSLLSDDGNWKWNLLGEDWSAFTQFWSAPENGCAFQDAYPYVLDLRISNKMKTYLQPLSNTSKFLVIAAYEDLYKRIEGGLALQSWKIERADNIAKVTRPILTQKGVLITGQPGTGMLPTTLV